MQNFILALFMALIFVSGFTFLVLQADENDYIPPDTWIQQIIEDPRGNLMYCEFNPKTNQLRNCS